MKRLFIIYALFFAQILRGVSQNTTILFSPQIVNANVSPDSFEVKARAFFKNTSNSTKKFVWKRTVIAMTSGWQSVVCDAKGCWAAAVNDAPEQIELAPNATSNIDVFARPNHISGAATIEVKVVEVGNDANVVTGRFLFATTTATKEPTKNNATVKIFPNPATDYFSIQDDYDVVEKVMVYNMIGRLMKNYNTSTNASAHYTINDLPDGLYIIRLLNSKGATIKTIRLNKAKPKA